MNLISITTYKSETNLPFKWMEHGLRLTCQDIAGHFSVVSLQVVVTIASNSCFLIRHSFHELLVHMMAPYFITALAVSLL